MDFLTLLKSLNLDDLRSPEVIKRGEELILMTKKEEFTE